MDREKVEINNPVVVAGVTLIPITKVSLDYWHSKYGFSSLGFKQPLSIAVISRSEKRAFRISGEEITLDQLILEAPGIQETLARI